MINHVQFPALGLEFTLNRVAFSLGGLDVYWYGIILALGLLAGMAFAFHYAVDFGIDSDRLVDVMVIGTVCGVACARIYYVAFAPFKYNSLWEMIDLRDGGIAIYGAVIGAFLFGGLACLWRKIPLLPTFDIVAISFLAGQGIGRWGNFMNQEAFGTNTTLPWGMISESTKNYLTNWQAALAAEGVTVDPSLPVHPTFLYESIWCLLGFLVLSHFFKKRRFNGQIFLSYIIWYGLGRAWIEGLRIQDVLLRLPAKTPTHGLSLNNPYGARHWPAGQPGAGAGERGGRPHRPGCSAPQASGPAAAGSPGGEGPEGLRQGQPGNVGQPGGECRTPRVCAGHGGVE